MTFEKVKGLTLLSAILLCLMPNNSFLDAADETKDQTLSREEILIVKNAYQLWKERGEQLWSGWTSIEVPMIFITEESEFALNYEDALSGFEKTNQSLFGRPVYRRDRVLPEGLAASFPFAGQPSVVIGTPRALEVSATRWSLIATHEMFHVLQMNRGSMLKVATLEIIDDQADGNWQLNYPFPYDNDDVMRLLHLRGYALYEAIGASEDGNAAKYSIGVCQDATLVLSSYLKQMTGDDRAFKYAIFQEWKEGIARYTEYNLAKLAAKSDFKPAADFTRLTDYETYEQVWERDYKSQVFLVKHSGRVSKSRSEFYNLGLGIGLALDASGIDWKDSYFASNVWMNNLLEKAAGNSITYSALSPNSSAPSARLEDVVTKQSVRIPSENRLSIIEFWQPWCPPCIRSIPQLKSIRKQFGDQIEIIGIVDRNPDTKQIIETINKHNVDWPTLSDEDGELSRKYKIEGYPHLFVVGSDGLVLYEHHGMLSDDQLKELSETIHSQLQGD